MEERQRRKKQQAWCFSLWSDLGMWQLFSPIAYVQDPTFKLINREKGKTKLLFSFLIFFFEFGSQKKKSNKKREVLLTRVIKGQLHFWIYSSLNKHILSSLFSLPSLPVCVCCFNSCMEPTRYVKMIIHYKR